MDKLKPDEVEMFKACLALAGVKVAYVSARIFYLVALTLPMQQWGRDDEGPWLDASVVRFRPIYRQESEHFASVADVESFVQKHMVKDA